MIFMIKRKFTAKIHVFLLKFPPSFPISVKISFSLLNYPLVLKLLATQIANVVFKLFVSSDLQARAPEGMLH